jgi:hypothetical protein
VENQDSAGKTNFFCSILPFNPLGSFIHMVACRSSSKNTRKMNLQPILNRNPPWAHIELEFNALGIAKKLEKHVVHLSKRKD